jgi:hypothetical protein
MSRGSYEIITREIYGYQDRLVPNKFFDQKGAAKSIALILPGLRYTCDMPLLYYTTELLLNKGFDILQLWADYNIPGFEDSTQAEQAQHLLQDSQALLNAVNHAHTYDRMLMVGKSIGTLSMTFILNMADTSIKRETIWLTPLLNLEPVAHKVQKLSTPVYLAGSTSDPTFDPGIVAQIQAMPNATLDLIKNADHSLEIPGDPYKSIQALSQVVTSLRSFLS